MPQLEPRYTDLAKQMTGELPDPEGQAMNMAGILTGSGADYLRIAAPRLARYVHSLPETFKVIESPLTFMKKGFENYSGNAYPRRNTSQPFVTFLNPAHDEKGRTAVHEILHALYQRSNQARGLAQEGYPGMQYTSKIVPGLEAKGARPSWNETLGEYAFRTLVNEAPEQGFRQAMAAGLGEPAIEGMTDMILKSRVENLVKGMSPEAMEYWRPIIMDHLTRGKPFLGQ